MSIRLCSYRRLLGFSSCFGLSISRIFVMRSANGSGIYTNFFGLPI